MTTTTDIFCQESELTAESCMKSALSDHSIAIGYNNHVDGIQSISIGGEVTEDEDRIMDRIEFLRGLQHKLHDDYNSTHEVVFSLIEVLLSDEEAGKRLMGGLAGLQQDLSYKHSETDFVCEGVRKYGKVIDIPFPEFPKVYSTQK